MTKKKSTHDIVSEAHDEIRHLDTTPEEIQAYAALKEKRNESYGVFTYSRNNEESGVFLNLHDTWKQKFGGRIHIDLGYVDDKITDDAYNITHLMLDKHTAYEFIEFVKTLRKTSRNSR